MKREELREGSDARPLSASRRYSSREGKCGSPESVPKCSVRPSERKLSKFPLRGSQHLLEGLNFARGSEQNSVVRSRVKTSKRVRAEHWRGGVRPDFSERRSNRGDRMCDRTGNLSASLAGLPPGMLRAKNGWRMTRLPPFFFADSLNLNFSFFIWCMLDNHFSYLTSM